LFYRNIIQENSNRARYIYLVVLGFILIFNQSWAQLSIEGSGADERPYVLGLPKINGDNPTQSGTLQSILIEDFKLSGLIKPINTDKSVDISKLELPQWAADGAEFLVLGSITNDNSDGKGEFGKEINLRIVDVLRNLEMQGIKVSYDSRQTAIVAHQIADAVIKRITGIEVGLSQLIAFVVHNANGYQIKVSDILGKNSHAIVHSRNPITSPTWSPNGNKIAYSSFEDGPASIFIQDVASGKRFKIPTDFDSATAPAWSPDGKSIAFSAYNEGRTGIYEYNLATNKISSLITDGKINTEPSYSGDGYLYYSSSRGRSPQIYRVNLSSKQSERISFEENYCTRPSSATSRPVVAYLANKGQKATILDNSLDTQISVSLPAIADGLAISPQGRLILFSVANNRNFNIIISNINGSYVKLVEINEYNFYEPSWRPSASLN